MHARAVRAHTQEYKRQSRREGFQMLLLLQLDQRDAPTRIYGTYVSEERYEQLVYDRCEIAARYFGKKF